MKYELAKELESAGYPQEFKRGSWICEQHGDDGEIKMCQCYGDMLVYNPTLSELVAWFEQYAEGGSLVSLVIKYEWTVNTKEFPAYSAVLVEAKGCGEESASWETNGEGNSPKEAVARLWLSLNQH